MRKEQQKKQWALHRDTLKRLVERHPWHCRLCNGSRGAPCDWYKALVEEYRIAARHAECSETPEGGT